MREPALRIFLNDNVIHHEQRGIARYFRKISDAIIEQFGDATVIFSPEQRDYGTAKHVLPPRLFGRTVLKGRNVLAAMVARLERATLVYCPYYGNMPVRVPEIYTVYDMIHERMPHHFRGSEALLAAFVRKKQRCLERAAVILSISQCTAEDVVHCYPHIDRSKIVVTPLGVDDAFFAGAQPAPAYHGRPYFLYVGHRGRHKNFMRLLTAFAQSGLARAFDLRVVSPGSTAFDQQERDCLKTYGLEHHVQLLTAVPDKELRLCYAHAAALVYPSEYEGFGLPILEAMASGTLVATSSVSSMPEVGGDIALYFDPFSVDSIAESLHQAANLAGLERQQRIARGRQHARMFTWERCQRQTVEVFQRLAAS